MAEPMKVGKKYWVRYRIPGLHRADRTMIAKYLGVVDSKNLSFSGRPQFGTTELEEQWILVVREVADHAEPHVDRKA